MAATVALGNLLAIRFVDVVKVVVYSSANGGLGDAASGGGHAFGWLHKGGIAETLGARKGVILAMAGGGQGTGSLLCQVLLLELVEESLGNIRVVNFGESFIRLLLFTNGQKVGHFVSRIRPRLLAPLHLLARVKCLSVVFFARANLLSPSGSVLGSIIDTTLIVSSLLAYLSYILFI